MGFQQLLNDLSTGASKSAEAPAAARQAPERKNCRLFIMH